MKNQEIQIFGANPQIDVISSAKYFNPHGPRKEFRAVGGDFHIHNLWLQLYTHCIHTNEGPDPQFHQMGMNFKRIRGLMLNVNHNKI